MHEKKWSDANQYKAVDKMRKVSLVLKYNSKWKKKFSIKKPHQKIIGLG